MQCGVLGLENWHESGRATPSESPMTMLLHVHAKVHTADVVVTLAERRESQQGRQRSLEMRLGESEVERQLTCTMTNWF